MFLKYLHKLIKTGGQGGDLEKITIDIPIIESIRYHI